MKSADRAGSQRNSERHQPLPTRPISPSAVRTNDVGSGTPTVIAATNGSPEGLPAVPVIRISVSVCPWKDAGSKGTCRSRPPTALF